MRLTTRSTTRNCLQLPPRLRSGDVISRVRNIRSVFLLITEAWSGLLPTNRLIEDRQDGHLSWTAMILISFIIIIIMFHLCMQPCGYGTTIYKVLEHQVPCLSFCLSYFPSCTLLRSTSFVSQFLSPACLLYLSSFKPKIVRK